MSDGMTLADIDEHVFGRGVFGRPRGGAAQIVVLLAVVAACAIFSLAARWFGLPELIHFDGSLLVGNSPAAVLSIVAVLLLITMLIGTLIAGCVRFEAGLFAACVGLTVLSLRSGTMQSVIFEAGGNSHVFVTLAIEMFVLSGILGLMWVVLWRIGRAS